jgi:hypothetical protein
LLLTNLILFKSTAKSKCAKKSLPIKAKATAANRNFHLKVWPPAVTVTALQPQQGMAVPSAAVIAGPEGGAVDVKGMTEYTAPVSTRYNTFDDSSARTARRPGRPGCAVAATAARPLSFPTTCMWPDPHSYTPFL